MIVISVQRCSKCDLMLPASDFNRDATSRYGLKCCCRACQNKFARARYVAAAAAGKRRVRRKKPQPKVALLAPLQPMHLKESLDCIQLRKWRGPVSPPTEFRSLGSRL